ncbi:MAG: DUF1697 domain-containing protein [Candidatus Eisenbacteria bacterium]|uniref:DUF1697 domain-containing protein n=1 Tax=Eiseniibacteriota bacterium TaxID=2212470 RepID=A0A933SAF7_UNCEI|nr:DUF1697 domain-containing protein [Candidatus Eisenbacteria bacterium]
MSAGFVALLRGINVGKGKRVPMADLRALLESLGHVDVKTLLNSGNAVFAAPRGAAPKLAAVIAAAIEKRFGFDVPVIVKSAADLDAMAAENSLAAKAADFSRLLTVFAQDPADLKSLAVLKPLLTKGEALLLGEHAAWLHCANGILESAAGEAVLGKVGRSGRGFTTRNWATVEKIRALMKSAG